MSCWFLMERPQCRCLGSYSQTSAMPSSISLVPPLLTFLWALDQMASFDIHPIHPPLRLIHSFQCYDKFILANLKTHAETSGNPYWGSSGPHDAPGCNKALDSTNFFKDNGGSWEPPYGDLFLSWYCDQLLSHTDRLLSIASRTFSDLPLALSAKVPLLQH